MTIETLMVLGPLIILLFFAALAFVIFLIVAWILMIVDCLQRNFKDGSSRIAWILVLLFLNVIGLVLYYFIVFRKGKRRKK